MKKLFISLGVTSLLVVMAGFGFYILDDKNEDHIVFASVFEDNTKNTEVNNGDIIISKYQLGMISELVPKGGYMLEEDLRQTIHYMSHQKVQADNKFGRMILITKELVEGLNGMLDNYEYEHEELYLAILNEWKEGNFENAVEHHNALWEIDGGNTGKATRLLTEEEEKAYITRYETVNEKKYYSEKLNYSFD